MFYNEIAELYNKKRKERWGDKYEENIKKLIYLSSKDDVRNLLLFSTCVDDKIKALNVEKLLNYIKSCEIPKFPISGDYLKKCGYETGNELGKKLKSLEEKWIANNFVLDEEVLKKSLKKLTRIKYI